MTETQVVPPAHKSPGQLLPVAGGILVTIGALYVGAGIFVPLVMAILLTFALSPVVRLLRRLRVPQVVAVLLSVGAAGVLIGVVSFLVVSELAHLASDLPQYQQVVATKLRALQQSTASGGVFERIAGGIQSVITAVSGTATTGTQPLPVIIVNQSLGPLSFGEAFLGKLLGPLATAAIVTVFVVCLLLERENFRDRFLKLVSRGDLRTSTNAMTDAGRRVSRYLLIQLAVNVSYGTIFGLGLFLIGVPDALLWGLLASLFRYIPFVGTLIAASLPLALAFAIDPHWNMLIAVAALFAGLEFTVTNAVEPRLYGSSTGLSALAVIVAAMFWATLWGPIGLILSTPLTVCLVVLGRYVPQLQFLETLLGSQPVLVKEEQLYQRLVSGNTEEAIELAEEFVASASSPTVFYDEVAIPALRLAESDRARDSTDLAGRRQVAEGMDAVVREVETLWPNAEPADPTSGGSRLRLLCIGGRTELDGAAASMLAQVISSETIEASVLPPVSLRPQGIGQIDLAAVDVLCIAYLQSAPKAYLRYAARHIRRKSPTTVIVACLFNRTEFAETELSKMDDGVLVVRSIAAAEVAITALWGDLMAADTADAVSAHSAAPDRLEHVRRLARSGDAVNEFTGRVAEQFGVQFAVVLAAERESSPETLEDTSSSKSALRSLRDATMLADETLVVEDVGDSAEIAENSFVVENGIGFFAGASLQIGDEDFGALMLFDQQPRRFSDDDRVLLRREAQKFVELADATVDIVAPLPSLVAAS